MPERTLQLVLHYDGARFAGWQRQPDARTVQGVLETTLARLCAAPTAALGAGRTDAGVHARGQAAGVRVAPKWTAASLRRALNATLPSDVWVAAAYEMRAEFHARYSATARAYRYVVGTDDEARSPFRRAWEWAYDRPLDEALLTSAAESLVGEHCFRAFAVRGTAPEQDDHRCEVRRAGWRRVDGRLVFEVEANRFLHHMVRFLVGTMVDVASGRREPDAVRVLLGASDNSGVSPPAPPHALFLERVEYPRDLYVETA
ncbi:MAG TPA: tRNA pseudouridine(38-40) synthase TruA [Gemmatimonadaceae bacterium]|nr:tRNA pseudouridine(38-40) synthase TruA [Gemmatimonadaceae bacterium]